MTPFEKLLGKKKQISTLQEILDNLRLLARAEADISFFYRLCAEAVAREKGFWQDLARAELHHAELIRKMIDLIMKEPKRYEPGYSFEFDSIRLFSEHVKSLADKIRAGGFNYKELLAAARDIENSAVELEFSRIVLTDKEEYNALARQIDVESHEHGDALYARFVQAAQKFGPA